MRLMCLSSWRHRWQAQNFTALSRWVHVSPRAVAVTEASVHLEQH